jgi:hypothetical protein
LEKEVVVIVICVTLYTRAISSFDHF